MLLVGDIAAKFQFQKELWDAVASMLQCCNGSLMVKAVAKSRSGSKICLKHSSHSIGVYPEPLDGQAGGENSKKLVAICLGLEVKNLKVTTQAIHSKILYWSLTDNGVLSELELKSRLIDVIGLSDVLGSPKPEGGLCSLSFLICNKGAAGISVLLFFSSF